MFNIIITFKILNQSALKNEKFTRKEIIEHRLKQADWNITDRTQAIEEFDIVVDKNMAKEALTLYSGYQFSDYVLLGKVINHSFDNLQGSLSQRAFRGELTLTQGEEQVLMAAEPEAGDQASVRK